jgi:chromosome segregation ATPase
VGSELCEQEEGKRADIFLNGDPQYMWQPEKAGEPVTDFEICGKIIFYEETEAIEVFRTHIDKLYDTIHSQGGTIEECRRTVGEKDAQLEAGNQQLREREQQIERLGEEKSRIEENVRQLNSQNEELADTIVEKDRQIVQKDDMLSDRDKQLAAQNEKIDELSGQLYHITHTKGYLALEKARHIKDRMQFWKK